MWLLSPHSSAAQTSPQIAAVGGGKRGAQSRLVLGNCSLQQRSPVPGRPGRVTCGERLPLLRRCTAAGAINYVQADCHKAIKSKQLMCANIATALSYHIWDLHLIDMSAKGNKLTIIVNIFFLCLTVTYHPLKAAVAMCFAIALRFHWGVPEQEWLLRQSLSFLSCHPVRSGEQGGFPLPGPAAMPHFVHPLVLMQRFASFGEKP